MRDEEVFSALRRLPEILEREPRAIEVMSRRPVSRLMAPHATLVKEMAHGADQTEKLQLLEAIFGRGEIV